MRSFLFSILASITMITACTARIDDGHDGDDGAGDGTKTFEVEGIQCRLPKYRARGPAIYRVCNDLRVTAPELVCMRAVMSNRNWRARGARGDTNIRRAFAVCWVINNGGFTAATPNLESVVDQYLRDHGVITDDGSGGGGGPGGGQQPPGGDCDPYHGC
jgi:hypothetical protein